MGGIIADGGLDLLGGFLDKEIDQKNFYRAIAKWETLEDCERHPRERVEDFVERFGRAHRFLLRPFNPIPTKESV